MFSWMRKLWPFSKKSGGTFTITRSGKESAPIPHDATEEEIQAILDGETVHHVASDREQAERVYEEAKDDLWQPGDDLLGGEHGLLDMLLGKKRRSAGDNIIHRRQHRYPTQVSLRLLRRQKNKRRAQQRALRLRKPHGRQEMPAKKRSRKEIK